MTDLSKVVADKYSLPGKISGFEKLKFKFGVSNEIYKFRSGDQEFILKQMVDAESLYGSSNAFQRLETVSVTINSLHQFGLDIENILPGKDGKFLNRHEKGLLRLYNYIPGHSYNKECINSCIGSLYALHKAGPEHIPHEVLENLSVYSTALPLYETVRKLPFIKEKLKEKACEFPDFVTLLENIDFIEKACKEVLIYTERSNLPKTIVHTDFHPHNVIIQESGKAVMIDMDNLIYAKPYKCIGFAVLRFASFSNGISKANLNETLQQFLKHWGSPPGLKADLINAMLFLEGEKILRILYRYFTTGTYPQFLKNLVPLHLANMKVVEQIKIEL